ncbi:hypothetical protein ACHAXT_001407 [Thalassiosira profunda]
MKAALAIAAAASACSTIAFQSQSNLARRRSPSRLFAKKKGGGSSGQGFGAPNPSGGKKAPKYSIDDKSYDLDGASAADETPEEARSSMADFFATHDEWRPLFSHVMSNPTTSLGASPLASSFLSDIEAPEEMWGMSTLERRHPWRLLPGKPTAESSLQILSTFLDEWQQSLLDIPLDSIVTGDNDMHFLEEGRRTIAVTRFHVLDEHHNPELNGGESASSGEKDWEAELFRTCWSEVAHLSSQDDADTGSLVLLPNRIMGGEPEGAGLDYMRQFVEHKLLRPIRWLGREEDWEIVAMERGSLAVRLLYKLGEIPDLSERDSSGDEEIAL